MGEQKNKNHSLRGPSLKESMIQSQKQGEEFRKHNQGQDLIDEKVNHEKSTTHNRKIDERSQK